MAFEVPHKHDISLDGQEMRNQMIENFEAIERAINGLQDQIDKLNQKDQEDQDFLKNLYKQEGQNGSKYI